MAFCKGRGTAGRCIGIGPYGSVTRGAMSGDRKGRPYEWVVGVDDPVRPGPITQRLVGQGPCALPGVREKSGSGRCRHRPLRRFDKKVPAWNPPVTASPCQPPLGKGAKGTGDADCHTSDIGHWFAMTHYKKCGASPGGRTEASAPTEGLPIEFRRGRCPHRPASVTRGAMRGRPQGSPLRRGYKECDVGRNPPVLRPFKIIFSSLLLSMQRMCFSGHR